MGFLLQSLKGFSLIGSTNIFMGISNCCLNLQEMTKLGICLCHKLRKKLIDASLTNKEESQSTCVQ